MTFRIGALAAVALLAACGSRGGGSAEAQAQVATAPFDLAGLSIGMSAKRAEQVLKAAGWSLRPSLGDSWKQTIAKQVARQRDSSIFLAPDSISGWVARKGDEALVVLLRPSTDGGAIEEVTYSAPIAGRTLVEFRAELAKRYGKPTFERTLLGDGGAWCSAGDPKCLVTKVPARLPFLTASYNDAAFGRVKIILRDGSAGQRAWETARDAAVRAAFAGKSSF